jgi:hypothetical protein
LAEIGGYTWHIRGNQWRSIVIPVRVGISLPIMGRTQQGELLVDANALIDTGATGSCMSDAFTQKMKLISFTKESTYSVHGIKSVPTERINLQTIKSV